MSMFRTTEEIIKNKKTSMKMKTIYSAAKLVNSSTEGAVLICEYIEVHYPNYHFMHSHKFMSTIREVAKKLRTENKIN